MNRHRPLHSVILDHLTVSRRAGRAPCHRPGRTPPAGARRPTPPLGRAAHRLAVDGQRAAGTGKAFRWRTRGRSARCCDEQRVASRTRRPLPGRGVPGDHQGHGRGTHLRRLSGLALEMIGHRTFDGRIQLVEYKPRVLDHPPLGAPALRRAGRRCGPPPARRRGWCSMVTDPAGSAAATKMLPVEVGPSNHRLGYFLIAEIAVGLDGVCWCGPFGWLGIRVGNSVVVRWAW